MTPTYKIDQFEGPLDLLLNLIEKNKIDINDIPISVLCDQYLNYLREAAEASIALSAEFIVMATELMLIKSRMLLPRLDPEEEDPRANLAAALLEYQRAKEAATLLLPRFGEFGTRMTKDTDEITVDKKYVADHDVSLLFKAYHKALTNVAISDEEAKKEFEPLIKQKIVTVSEVTDKLANALRAKKPVVLEEFFLGAKSKSELVSMFMSLLEMLKTGFLNINEKKDQAGCVIDVYSSITIELRPSVTDEEFDHAINDMKKSEF